MNRYEFTQVDVFTDTPLKGNPLAVVHGADALSEAQMQAFAHWTNLSETTFLLQPTKALCEVGVIGAHETGAPAQFEVRAFAASQGIIEDPVTGSLNASLAQWLMEDGLAPHRYLASQGARLGRVGRVDLLRESDTVWVGAAA